MNNMIKSALVSDLDSKLNFRASYTDEPISRVNANYVQSGNYDSQLATTTTTSSGTSGGVYTTGAYRFWTDYYYPDVIRSSYPVYIQERALDKGKQAFEIIKVLKDKKLVNLKKVVDFIDLMDELIKIL